MRLTKTLAQVANDIENGNSLHEYNNDGATIKAGNFESFGDFLNYYRQHYRPLLEAIRNGFAPSGGFPVDAAGGTVNDRDYERDKDAQTITRKIAAEYDARAIQSPVIVSRDGVVLSGNGDTLNEQQRHTLNFMADDFIKMFWDKE